MNLKRLRWWFQFWWIPVMTVFMGLIAKNLMGFDDTVIISWIIIGVIVIFNFFSWRYAVIWYRKLLKDKKI